MINYNKKFIFIHLIKVAGISIEVALKSDTLIDHRTVKQYIKHLGLDTYHSFFSFTFVRNPWDRLVSMYTFTKTGGFWENKPLNKTDEYSCNEWIKNIEKCYDPEGDDYKKYTNQVDWLTNFNDEIDVNFIGKFENLQKDWKRVCKFIDVSLITLPHVNATKRNRNYKDYYKLPNGKYDFDAIEKVRELNYKDIEEFGYTFD